MKLDDFLKKDLILVSDKFKSTDHFYQEIAHFLKKKNLIKNSAQVKRLFVKRERIQSTAIGKGVATPHIYSGEFAQFTLAVALIKEGIDFKAPDGERVYLVFLIMSDERDVGLHLKLLSHIARLTDKLEPAEKAKKLNLPEELFDFLVKIEQEIL